MNLVCDVGVSTPDEFLSEDSRPVIEPWAWDLLTLLACGRDVFTIC